MDTVVLLHGLGRTRFSMAIAASRLRKAGFTTESIGYPSRVRPIEEHAEWVRARLPETTSGNLHFLTHSMGGIVLRALIARDRPDHLGRVVMLSPPNQGSEIADLLNDYSLYHLVLGPAAGQLGTGEGSLVRQLKPVKGEIGIITGDNSSDPWFSPVIPGEDDGKVSVESAKLDEMSDFITVHNGHTFIMRDDSVINQILYFLKHGNFNKKALPPAHD
jgi:triacylglycerol lipase